MTNRRSPRNAGLITILSVYRDYLAGTITADQGFQMIIFSELEPKERIILHHVTEHPNVSGQQVADTVAISLVHADTALKRLVDLGLLERTIYYGVDERHYVYQLRDWKKLCDKS